MSTELSLRLGREPLRLCLDALPETAREPGDRGQQVLRRACSPAPGLRLTAEILFWPEHSVRETLVCLTNTGDSPTEILSDFCLEETLPAADAALRHGNGDTCRTDGYHWQKTPLTEEITLSPADGTSCNGAFPYFRLETPAGGYNLAVGWPARWQAAFRPGEAAVSLALSQKRCHTRLLPGETFRLPRLTVQQYEGTPRTGANAWRRWYLSCLMPLDYGKPMSPKYCLHNWFSEGMPEFTGATEENQIRALNRYVAHGLKPDIWWVDAGWYPCHGDWTHTGTWTWDKSRFPRGLAPLGQACAQAGAQLLLWFEPERVRPQTCLAENHPQWLLHAKKDDGTEMENMLLNLGDPACLQALTAHINALIQEAGVKIYRQEEPLESEMPPWIIAHVSTDRHVAAETMRFTAHSALLEVRAVSTTADSVNIWCDDMLIPALANRSPNRPPGYTVGQLTLYEDSGAYPAGLTADDTARRYQVRVLRFRFTWSRP